MKTQQMLDNLPDSLKPYRDKIESTIKSFIRITAHPTPQLTPWQSKFGGTPYLPKRTPYPTTANGTEMVFLAQLNFAEMPRSAGFPSEGILQFYIADDDIMGLFEEDGSKVIYHSSIDINEGGLQSDFGFIAEQENSPIGQPCALSFEIADEPMSINDYQFDEIILGIDASTLSDEMKETRSKLYVLFEEHVDLFISDGHKVCGYPYFTQWDPRNADMHCNEGYQLLFQIDTDFEKNIMWGDAGVGNFFIKPDDLANLDFSNVLYNWDCC